MISDFPGEGSEREKDHSWALEASTESSSGLIPGSERRPLSGSTHTLFLGESRKEYTSGHAWGKRGSQRCFLLTVPLPWEGDVTEKNGLCSWTQLGVPTRAGLGITTVSFTTSSPYSCFPRLLGL